MADIHTLDPLGVPVDLDDLDSFSEEDRNKKWYDLRLDCMYLLGGALVYMSYLHPFPDGWEPQASRIKKLCGKFALEFMQDDHTHWLKFKWHIRNEIENMC